MGVVVATITGFLAAACTFVAAAAALCQGLGPRVAATSRVSVLSASRLGGLVRVVARCNSGARLSPLCGRIEERLLLAGKPGGDLSGAEYLALAELCGVAVFAALVVLTALGAGLGPGMLAFALVLGVAATWVSYAYLDNLIAARTCEIARTFPYFLDLAVMTSEAGSTFRDSLEIYVRDNPGTALGEELQVVAGELTMGRTLEEALDGLRRRTRAQQVHETVNALMQGLRMGTPLGGVLRDQADAMRFRRSQLAERAAEELKVRIQGPAMVLMISVFLLILGPAFIEMIDSGIF